MEATKFDRPLGLALERGVSPRATGRGYAAIGLFQPKSAVNVGSAMRAAGCYGAVMVATTGRRFGRSPTDTMKTYRHLPLIQPCLEQLTRETTFSQLLELTLTGRGWSRTSHGPISRAAPLRPPAFALRR